MLIAVTMGRKVDAAIKEGRTTNWGCISTYQGTGPTPWSPVPNGFVTPGRCLCDNWLMNEIADTVLEAMPMIAQVGERSPVYPTSFKRTKLTLHADLMLHPHVIFKIRA
jgi:hypothetical protein